MKNLCFILCISLILISCSKDKIVERDNIHTIAEKSSISGTSVIMENGVDIWATLDQLDGPVFEFEFEDADSSLKADIDLGADFSNICSVDYLTQDIYSFELDSHFVAFTAEIISISKSNMEMIMYDSSNSDTTEISIVSTYYDLRDIVDAWDKGDIEPRGWGWVAGALIGVGAGIVLNHCGDVVSAGIDGCVQAGGLPQAGFCSVECCPQTGC